MTPFSVTTAVMTTFPSSYLYSLLYFSSLSSPSFFSSACAASFFSVSSTAITGPSSARPSSRPSASTDSSTPPSACPVSFFFSVSSAGFSPAFPTASASVSVFLSPLTDEASSVEGFSSLSLFLFSSAVSFTGASSCFFSSKENE